MVGLYWEGHVFHLYTAVNPEKQKERRMDRRTSCKTHTGGTGYAVNEHDCIRAEFNQSL